jgi:hypothetical protein
MGKEEFLAELEEIKNLIINKSFNLDQVNNSLLQIEESLNNAPRFNAARKSNILKSLLITFNLTNFSDLTFIFDLPSERVNVIEYAGDEILIGEVKVLIDSDSQFLKETDSIKIKGCNYRLFYESIDFNDKNYFIISMTESNLYSIAKFHALCNIAFDIIRYIYSSNETIYRDLFQKTIIDVNTYMNDNLMTDSELFLFRFKKIYSSFYTMDLGIMLDISESIKEQLKKIFKQRAAIFRFSLSEYIAIPERDYLPAYTLLELNNNSEVNFSYKGVVLQHSCTKISANNQSIYNIFENIYEAEQNKTKP